MPDARTLSLLIETIGLKGLDAIVDSFAKIDGVAKLTAQDLTRYEQAAKAGVITSDELARAMAAVAANTTRAAQATAASSGASDRATSSARAHVGALGQQAAALQQLATAERAAADATALRAVRGAASLSSFAGLAPAGIGGAISGVSGIGALGGAAAPIAAAGAAIAALTTGILSAANSLGTYAREQENVASRTGLTVTETQLFGKVADVAGINAGSLTTSMRTLSRAMNENSDEGKKGKAALRELGLGAETAFLPTKDALDKIFTALGNVTSAVERDRLAIALLGRGGLELAPLFGHFKSLSDQVSETGVVITEEGIKKAAEYRREAALLGLAWDSVVNKFKQKAVGTVSFIINDVGTTLSGAKFLFGAPDVKDVLGGAVARNTTPNIAPASAINSAENAAALKSIKERLGTPKDRLDQQLKDLKGERDTAEQQFTNAARGTPDQLKAQASIFSIDAQQKAVKAQLDGLKDGKRASEETLRLREQLIGAQEKELFGALKITAEYDKQILKLKDKREATPLNVGLAAQIRDVNLERNQRQSAVADEDNGRKIRSAQLEEEQQRTRAGVARQNRLIEQDFANRGDEKGGAQAEFAASVAAAQKELDFAKERAALAKVTAIEELKNQPGGTDLLKGKLRAAQIIEDKAASQFQQQSDAAREQLQIRINTLKAKDRKEDEETSKRAIETARLIEQLAVSRSRTIAEGQTRLAITNANPGFELQARLNADAKRLQADRDDAARAAALNNQAIASKQAEIISDPARKHALELEIDSLRTENLRDSAKIENDIIRARFDAEDQIAQKRKSDEAAFRDTASGFFNAAQQGKGQDFLRGIGQNLLSKIEGNVAGLAFPTADRARQGISQKLSGTADDPTFIGKLLAGTPFGPTTKNPIEGNTSATALNTAATLANTGTLAAIATGKQLPGGDSVKGTGTAVSASPLFGAGTTGGLPASDPLNAALKTAATLGAATGTAASTVAAGTRAPLAVTDGLRAVVTSTFTPLSDAGGKAALAAIAAGTGAAIAATAGVGSSALSAITQSIKPITAIASTLSTSTPKQPSINELPGGNTAAGLLGGVKSLFSGGTGLSNAPTVSATDLQRLGLAKPLGVASTTDAASSRGFGGLSGIAAGAGSIGDFRGIFTGVGSQPGGGAQTLSSSERIGAAVGTAAALYGAERGIAQALKGGASNVTGGLASAAASIAPLTGPAAPFVAAGAMALSLVSAIIGDPRLKRQQQIQKELDQNVFQAPVAINKQQDIFGHFTDFDKFGKLQTSTLSATPQVSQPYIERRNGTYYDVGGQLISPFGGPSTSSPAAPVNINVTAFDAQSVHSYFTQNPDIANSIVHVGLTQASGPAQQSVKEAAGLG